MFRNLLGLSKKKAETPRDEEREAIAPTSDPAQDRLARLASRGQSQAAKEKFAKAPPVPKPALRANDTGGSTHEEVGPVDAAELTEHPEPAPNEVHDLLDTLEQGLADPPSPLAAPKPKRPHPALRKARTQAIMFRQHLPPRSEPTDLSFWGGKPRLPQDFEWPSFTASDGEVRALSFIGQIDCGRIPADAGFHLLPDHGVLAFFMDLHWGAYWEWKVVHCAGSPADFVEHEPPTALPPAFADVRAWGWPRCDADWPRLLPKWSMEPVVVRAAPDADASHPYWPGAIDRDTATAAIAEMEAGIEEATEFTVSRDAKGELERPFDTFPQDWQAIRIALAHLDRVGADPSLKSTKKARNALATDSDTWREKLARADKAGRPLSKTARNDFWRFLKVHDKFSEPCLASIVIDSVEATLGSGEAALLPDEAVRFVTQRHRFSAGDERMLCAPTFVQMEAEERVGEWLLLLEMGANPGLGHHFAEGVYQFWIRPEDLAEGRFERVELSAESY